ncbi:MAG: BBP7 family outer membrane beta-barrel protein [Planctomycetota bacterium]
MPIVAVSDRSIRRDAAWTGGWRVAATCWFVGFAVTSSAWTQTDTRRIPVRRPSSTPNTARSADRVTPADYEADGPIAEQPGEVTEIIIRNEAGEIIEGELGQGEFFVGPRPAPVIVGDPAGRSVVHSIADDGTVAQAMPGQTPLPTGTTSCSQCDTVGCHGDCGPTRSPRNADLARAEAIARVLANPFADFWVRAEYVHLFVDGQPIPALVTTGPSTADVDDAGVIGQTGVTVLVGNERLDEDDRSAGRFELGRYLSDTGLAVSASFLFSEDVSSTFIGDATTADVLARPFIDLSPGSVGYDAELISYPGTFAGDVTVGSNTEFGMADALVHAILISTPTRRLDGFIGYQYLMLDDDLHITDSKRVVGGTTGLTISSRFTHSDQFRTRNDFHGVAIGARTRICHCGWAFSTSLKLALGLTDVTVHRDGTSTSDVAIVGGGTDSTVSNTGLLIQDSNRGTRDFDSFSVAPELNFRLARRLASGWDASMGYQLICWSRVARAGDQIDLLVNQTQSSVGGLQGIAAPGDSIIMDDLIAHGLTFGLSREF